MAYVDGFVLAVPTANREKFREMAAEIAPIFRDYGALRVVECWGEDVPDGVVTSFPMAVQRGPDETVVFSWVEWPDKATRDRGHAEMMKDPRFESSAGNNVFDGKRMIYGGFQPIVDE